MPVNYRVSGDVPITPAIAPVQHNWNPLYRSLELDEAKRQAKAEAQAKEQEAKAKQAADEAKYNPGGVMDVDYNDVVHNKGMEVLDYSAQSYASGKTGSSEHNYVINKKRQEAELYKGKSNAAIAEYTKAYQNIDQLPKYVNKNQLNTEVYNVSHPKGKDGKIDLNSIDPKAISQIPNNYYGAINSVDMYDDKGKNWAEKIQKGEIQFPVEDPNNPEALQNVFKSDMYKAKFFKPIADKYGKITYVPGVTDNTAQFIMENDPEILGEAKYRYEKYIEEETKARAISYANGGQNKDPREVYNEVTRTTPAGKFMLGYVKGHLERINSPTHETENKTTVTARPGGDKDKDKVKLEDPTESNINLVIGDEKNGTSVQKAYVPSERLIKSKGEGKVLPLTVNSEEFINVDTNDKSFPTGSQTVYPRAIVKLPMQKIKGQDQIFVNSKEKVLTNKNVYYREFVDGQVEYEYTKDDGTVITKKKSVLIPIEKVANELTERGVNMNDYIPKASDPYGVKK